MISMQQKSTAVPQTVHSSALYREMVNEPSADINVHLSPNRQTNALQPGMPSMQGELAMNMPAQADSWKNMMARNLGKEVVISSLVGSQKSVIAQGTLYEVGNDYVTLYHPGRQSLISTDIYAIRYIEFLPERAHKPMEVVGWQDTVR